MKKVVSHKKTTLETRAKIEEQAPAFHCGFGPVEREAGSENDEQSEITGEPADIAGLLAELGLSDADLSEPVDREDAVDEERGSFAVGEA